MVTDPVPPAVMLKLLKVRPPPKRFLSVLLVSEITIVEVFELNVSPVVKLVFHTCPVPVTVHVPEPIVTVRVAVVLLVKTVHVTFLLFASKVPLLNVSK